MKLSVMFTYSRGVDAQFSGQYEKSSSQYVDIHLWRRVTFKKKKTHKAMRSKIKRFNSDRRKPCVDSAEFKTFILLISVRARMMGVCESD